MVFFIHYYIVMKSSLILFFFTLNQVLVQSGDTGIRHESFFNSGVDHCSAENHLDIAHIEEASKGHYKMKYCTFVKEIKQPQDKECKQETNFIFHEFNEKKYEICGTTPFQTMHAISYQTCGDQSDLKKFRDEKFRKEPVLENFKRWYNYEVCYDTAEKKVLWTRHTIKSPQRLQNQGQSKPFAISTDPYFFTNPDIFIILEKQYALEKKKDSSEVGAFTMVPQPLVPQDHFAVNLNKKSTNHYLNMAPLWENLVPLMKVIDQGIIHVKMKSTVKSKNLASHDDLIILTRVEPSENVDTTSEEWFNLLLFRGNIWYKLIYLKEKKVAAMIIIHNTPGNTPSKGCVKGEQMKCDFRTWTDDEEMLSQITLDHMKYAYCCKVNPNQIASIFAYSYTTYEYLDIDSLITKN